MTGEKESKNEEMRGHKTNNKKAISHNSSSHDVTNA